MNELTYKFRLKSPRIAREREVEREKKEQCRDSFKNENVFSEKIQV